MRSQPTRWWSIRGASTRRRFSAGRSFACAVALALVLVALSPLGSVPARAGPFPNLLDPPMGATSLGPVTLENPEIHNIYLDGSWDDDNPTSISKANIDAITQGLVDSDYFSAASQYGVTSPSFTGSDEKANFPCGVLAIVGGEAFLATISTWLACELGPTVPGGDTAGGFDAPDDNSLYMVYLPQGTTLAEHPCSGIHVWASTFVYDFVPFPALVSQTFAYAVIPADCALSQPNPLEAISKAASHEIIEAATDRIPFPDPVGWIDRSLSLPDQLSDGEAADICQTGAVQPKAPAVRLTTGVLVRPYWSNVDRGCVPFGAQVTLDETGLPATVPHTATVNGNTVTLKFTDTLELGSALSFSYPSPVNDPTPGIRYVTPDPGQTLTVKAPVKDTAAYTRQFFLTTGTAPSFLAAIDPSLTPSDWHDEGEVVALDTSTPIPTAPGTRYRFDHWSGDVAALTPQASVTMTAPKTAIATYVLQFLLTVQTSGLGANLTHISNSSGALGTANDTTPLVVWIDADSAGTLSADANVNGANGVQYFFQGFVPPPPATLTSPFTTTAVYKTMAQLIDEGLASGGITGPGAQGVANALKQKFDAIQHDMAAPHYAAALGDLKAFINSVQAQCCTTHEGKTITSALATTLQLDALLVFHNALCLALSAGEINAQLAATDYTYYRDLETSLGGTVLPPC
jgi:hypothetical protein